MTVPKEGQRALLLRVARQAMLDRGLQPDMPAAAIAEAAALVAPAAPFGSDVRDLRALPWCSIDNDDSRDLDQLTAAEPMADGGTLIRIAVADVDASVHPGSAVDAHAAANTTSVYTPTHNFLMLPERMCTDLTSLGAGEDRMAIVVETTVTPSGPAGTARVFRAVVRNQAKLTYSGVGAWLEGRGPLPPAAAAVSGLADNLKLQDAAAQKLQAWRHEHGALELETLEAQARFEGDKVSGLEPRLRNRAMGLIEDFMIAANGAIARFLAARRFPVMRRVVRSPERWQRIVDIATHLGDKLPATPDNVALHDFLLRRQAADPLRFPDLSLSVIKLLGRGEYVASFPGDEVTGHFGLAVSDYSHSTAPNRRYPDILTQRLVKAALAGAAVPYTRDALGELATHCTAMEDAAQKVERRVRKSAAACLLADRVGQQFEGIVTGAGPKGTWARALDPQVEGRVEQGEAGLDVGDRVSLRLIRADAERGFIDFARIGQGRLGSTTAAAKA